MGDLNGSCPPDPGLTIPGKWVYQMEYDEFWTDPPDWAAARLAVAHPNAAGRYLEADRQWCRLVNQMPLDGRTKAIARTIAEYFPKPDLGRDRLALEAGFKSHWITAALAGLGQVGLLDVVPKRPGDFRGGQILHPCWPEWCVTDEEWAAIYRPPRTGAQRRRSGAPGAQLGAPGAREVFSDASRAVVQVQRNGHLRVGRER